MNNTLSPYEFSPIIQQAYSSLHRWLQASCEDAAGYKDLDFKTSIGPMLTQRSVLSSALQFNTLFHSHFFKVKHTLEQVIGLDALSGWLNFNPYLCVVDIGCGAGAASAAVLEAVFGLEQQGRLLNPVRLFFIGVDPNASSLLLYHKLLENLRASLDDSLADLDFRKLPQGIPDAGTRISNLLEQQRDFWEIPCLPQVLTMQVNVVSPLDMRYQQQVEEESILRKYLGESDESNPKPQFGEDEAMCYKFIFQSTNIDHLHIVTISTDNYMLPERVAEMSQAVYTQFHSSQHLIAELTEPEEHVIDIRNPVDSYWNDNGFTGRRLDPFYVDVSSIENANLQKDTQWKKVIDADNIERAWSRVRRQMLREDLVDEVEIRLFERNLGVNLARLREVLVSYAHELLPVGQLLGYNIPKNEQRSRPRDLSRIEEEILSVAIIQQLGQRFSALRGESYAYRLSRNRFAEYLYQPYWVLYKEFINDARGATTQYPQACVLRTDIKSFYTQIIQDRLVELAESEMFLDRRVKWLLYLLISKEINAGEIGHGLVQGGIGSGFYANVYLTPIDEIFGKTNEWNVKYFRYVDDIIFIIPNPDDLEEVERVFNTELQELKIEQNPTKRKVFHNAQDFLNATEVEANNEVLEQLSKKADTVLSVLWIADTVFQKHFQDHFDESSELWWHQVERYRGCLTELGIYITPDDLSRKIFRYLYNDDRRQKDWPTEFEIVFPSLPPDNSIAANLEWSHEFRELNPAWAELYVQLRSELIQLFKQAVDDLENSLDPEQERLLQQHVRFAAGKLGYLGFAEIIEELSSVLCNRSWVLSKHLYLLEQIARQGFYSKLALLLNCYDDPAAHTMNEYMRAAILRALRFLPKNIMLDWDDIANFSTGDSVVEALMATETWLFRNPAFPPIQQYHIDAIWDALHADPSPPAKLKKNYLLLIGRYAPDLITNLEFDDEGDHLLKEILNLLLQGETVELFDYAEPEELRRKYYSGRRKDDRTDMYIPT